MEDEEIWYMIKNENHRIGAWFQDIFINNRTTLVQALLESEKPGFNKEKFESEVKIRISNKV